MDQPGERLTIGVAQGGVDGGARLPRTEAGGEQAEGLIAPGALLREYWQPQQGALCLSHRLVFGVTPSTFFLKQ
ncbi:MAG: hypothetical protein DME24_24850 [Verrucomicrobia bacterium]|nr:MAG: hypothetical protein DME24_24850 [Verrucomicrobiota bacterium]